MKSIVISILLIGIITTSCSAQKKIAALSDNVITKAKLESYMIKKEQQKVTIENSNNKLTNIKQTSPNLPFNIPLIPYYVKPNLQELKIIFAKYMTIKELENLSINSFAGISIDIRCNTTGKIREVLFFTDKNSILSLEQLENIEHDIITTKNMITIKPEAERYIKGSNFLLVDTRLVFSDILKVKKTL